MKIRHFFLFFPFLGSCAILHHAQVGDVDDRSGKSYVPFEIKVSETGIDTEEASRIVGALSRNSKAAEDLKTLQSIYALFNMGPRTGNPVYNETYAESLLATISQECPSGEVKNLVSIREMRKYPVISGEIIKITGLCLKKT